MRDTVYFTLPLFLPSDFSNNSYLVYDMSGLFRLRALSFIKIPSSHVGNFRKAVVFIVESGI